MMAVGSGCANIQNAENEVAARISATVSVYPLIREMD